MAGPGRPPRTRTRPANPWTAITGAARLAGPTDVRVHRYTGFTLDRPVLGSTLDRAPPSAAARPAPVRQLPRPRHRPSGGAFVEWEDAAHTTTEIADEVRARPTAPRYGCGRTGWPW
ncbi:hypothetical protein [Micromonospora sp. HM5-17]|uniref:hypothetical protein n=1 Tax=Micromonospora sp. HM5-17 TaxID=2487710 RepID=UPI000F45F7A5|nr:hypothetical protein [Micromonospora sp. HM5-17]ROT32426.1 hypothetical protein EF879_12880 [Micromonospora sp. HM5-17]